MTNIIVKPEDFWDFFEENLCEELENTVIILASNNEWGIEVVLECDNLDYPEVAVTQDGTPICSEVFISREDARRGLSKIYDKYLSERIFDDDAFEENFDDEERVLRKHIDAIAEREDELYEAIADFFYIATGCIAGSRDYAIIEDLKEHILEYMARVHGLNIYRPMFLEYADGSEEFFEYPYEEIEYEDDINS